MRTTPVEQYLVEVEARLDTFSDKLDAYSYQTTRLAQQRDKEGEQLRLLIRYVEEQLPRVIGQTLNVKQREEPLVRELAHSLNTPIAQLEATLLSSASTGDTASMMLALEVCKSYIAAFRQVATLAADTGGWKPDSLQDMLVSAGALYANRADKALKVDVTVPAVIAGYETNTLVAILLILLENAIEAAPPKSVVAVDAAFDNDVWVFEVSNDVEGAQDIPPDVYQKHWSTKPGHEGLGLDAARNLLAAITTKDLTHRRAGDRVTFTFRLPRRQA